LALLWNEASWRSGDVADCKSAHPGSIPGEASNFLYLAIRVWRGLNERLTWRAYQKSLDWHEAEDVNGNFANEISVRWFLR
jgi:hypothetical protein